MASPASRGITGSDTRAIICLNMAPAISDGLRPRSLFLLGQRALGLGRAARLPLVRPALFIRAEPHRICQSCSPLSQVEMERTLWTRLFVRFIFNRALSHHVVAASHVITLIAAWYRTGKPVISLFKKASRMQDLLGKNHGQIVVKAERRDTEQHLRLRHKRLTCMLLYRVFPTVSAVHLRKVILMPTALLPAQSTASDADSMAEQSENCG